MVDSIDVALQTDEEKVSYGFGLQFGQQLLQNKFEGLSFKAVVAGMEDIFENQTSRISNEELNPSFEIIKARQAEAAEAQTRKVQELGETFMAENAKREGVKVTDSGMQYEILEEGSGEKPSATSVVKTHYHGTFIDGRVFDSSVERGEPTEFGVNQVISGWTEALQMMPVGSKWRIALPAHLAYGEAGAGGSIPPNSSLVFEIHLIDIVS
jgi:FKBP-type peptidyl-prolyl cis-trans isomerase FklB